jgi:hypothetical protein
MEATSESISGSLSREVAGIKLGGALISAIVSLWLGIGLKLVNLVGSLWLLIVNILRLRHPWWIIKRLHKRIGSDFCTLGSGNYEIAGLVGSSLGLVNGNTRCF